MKKLIILAVLILVVLGGSGTAAWYFLLREVPDEEVAKIVPQGPERIFVDLDPMVMSVMRDEHAVRHLTFMIILEVEDLTKRNRVVVSTLRLRDAFRHELHSMFSRRIMQNRDDAMPIASKRLMAVSEEMLGAGVVQRVLINVMTNRDLEAG